MQTGSSFYPIPYLTSSEEYFRRLGVLPHRVWLDSGRPYSTLGRFDILCAKPSTLLQDPDQHIIDTLQQAYCDEWSDHLPDSDIKPPFCGGLIGYFNYEYRHRDFHITMPKTEQSASVLASFDWALIQDHHEQRSYIVFHPRCHNATVIIKVIEATSSDHHAQEFSVANLSSDLSKRAYFSAIKDIQQHLVDGDCYQINLTQRFSGEFTGSAEAAYTHLRQHMPSPFSAYLELSEDVVMSFSPERFIEIDQGYALTQPIKGTAARKPSPEEDQALAIGLTQSEKNRAENLMIVDLLRNDFSQSCEPFSVKVPKLFELQSFANVHHLVSTIVGKIKPGLSNIAFFMRCFPGGSITGAPKKRAMEIIDTLETAPRNAYCGSICYFSANARCDSNIAIRTLLVRRDTIYCWGGGGIVFDSIAEDEYQESIQKIAVLLDALKKHTTTT